MSNHCPQCGAAFDCAVATRPDAQCWCMQLPVVPRQTGGDGQPLDCLCQRCLQAAISRAASPAAGNPS